MQNADLRGNRLLSDQVAQDWITPAAAIARMELQVAVNPSGMFLANRLSDPRVMGIE
jgi:hypothetical protein